MASTTQCAEYTGGEEELGHAQPDATKAFTFLQTVPMGVGAEVSRGGMSVNNMHSMPSQLLTSKSTVISVVLSKSTVASMQGHKNGKTEAKKVFRDEDEEYDNGKERDLQQRENEINELKTIVEKHHKKHLEEHKKDKEHFSGKKHRPGPSPQVQQPTGSQKSCGGHYADSCANCPQGHGAAWCNGECKWSAGACVDKSNSKQIMAGNSQLPIPSDQTREIKPLANKHQPSSKVTKNEYRIPNHEKHSVAHAHVVGEPVEYTVKMMSFGVPATEKLRNLVEEIGAVSKANELAGLTNQKAQEEATDVLRHLEEGKTPTLAELEEAEIAAAEGNFADLVTAETAADNQMMLTAHDIAEVTGVQGEDVDASGTLPAFEGDEIPADMTQLTLLQRTSEAQRKGASGYKTRAAGLPWAGGIIKYCFANDVKAEVKHLWVAATHQYMKALPCLNFKDVGWKTGTSMDRAGSQFCQQSPAIFVMSHPYMGCYSYVGMVPQFKSQQMQLHLTACFSIGLYIHEIGHALGMAHEQSRPDRDAHVRIAVSNVQNGKMHNFNINHRADTSLDYDYLSVMHYDAYTFAKDTSRPTIVSNATTELGNRVGLSIHDVKHLENMYQQTAQCRANALKGTGCIDRLQNGKVVCPLITKCTAEIIKTKLCCSCGGGWKVQCYQGQSCPHMENATPRSRPATAPAGSPCPCPSPGSPGIGPSASTGTSTNPVTSSNANPFAPNPSTSTSTSTSSSPSPPPPPIPPVLPALQPEPADCIVSKTFPGYDCVFTNVCDFTVQWKCPSHACKHQTDPGGYGTQSCNGKAQTEICKPGVCKVERIGPSASTSASTSTNPFTGSTTNPVAPNPSTSTSTSTSSSPSPPPPPSPPVLTPLRPEPADCIVSKIFPGYDCVFRNACDFTVQWKCPSHACKHQTDPGGYWTQSCNGKPQTEICKPGVCKVERP